MKQSVAIALTVLLGIAFVLSAPRPATGSADPTNAAPIAPAEAAPTLYVFFPLESCAVKYCVTADALERQIARLTDAPVDIVQIPVYGAHVYTNGTPPPLFIDWTAHPSLLEAEWLPPAELTDYGWGLADAEVVLVSADTATVYQLGDDIDWAQLSRLLIASAEAPSS